MEKQHTAFQAEEEQILADNGDKDEGDGDIELNNVSWVGSGSLRIVTEMATMASRWSGATAWLNLRTRNVDLSSERNWRTMIGGSPQVTSPPHQPSLLVRAPGEATPLNWRPSLWVLQGSKSAAQRQPT